MKHKHYDVIVAQAEGKPVQVKVDESWKDIGLGSPMWFKEREYRVKPKTILYRVALCLNKETLWHFPAICTKKEDEREIELSRHFVRWLTDWVEVEI